MYTQNNEHLIFLPFLKEFDPEGSNFLDIGANDGIFFSNTWDLSLLGWGGCCIEPSPSAFPLLQKNHSENERVHLFNFGISDSSGTKKFYDSSNWLGRTDTPPAALSSLIPEHKNNFYGMQWEEIECEFVTFEAFLEQSPIKKFDFISIDVEGHDYAVLQQIDLDEIGCKLICLEHSQNENLLELYTSYCTRFGLKEIGSSIDNILFGKS